MKIDLEGRIRNIPLNKKQNLLPLYEAVSNSIHAVQEAGRSDGEIEVRILRNASQTTLDGEPLPGQPIFGFEVWDNGVGFNEANFRSFETSDSTKKRELGGKGVGRLLWLKAFKLVQVESVFRDEDGARHRRRFSFRLPDGVSEPVVEPTDDEEGTTVRLLERAPEYRPYLRFETIANHLIQHFLPFFVLEQDVTIVLTDPYERSNQDLTERFRREVRHDFRTSVFTVKGRNFAVHHFLLDSALVEGNRHQLHFCANQRPVKGEDATRHVPNLHGALAVENEERQFAYAGYVTGDLLDETGLQDRAAFSLFYENAGVFEADEVAWTEIVDEASKVVATYLRPYTEPIRERKNEYIAEFVRQHPRYRHLLKQRPDWIDRIPAGARDEELDLELFKLDQQFQAEVRIEGRRLSAVAVKKEEGIEGRRKKLAGYLSDMNQLGMSKLADYVVHRKATLDFLRECLSWDQEGEFKTEDLIHETVFPVRTDSEETVADQTNLWIIDERLSYHLYLASDRSFKKAGKFKVAKEGERRRMDLCVLNSPEGRYDTPHAFSESRHEYDSITIVEFKRPGRDDYTNEKNPIDQVENYVELIRDGHAIDRNGIQIRVDPHTPFYGYIVCTLTKDLERLARKRGFIPMPADRG